MDYIGGYTLRHWHTWGRPEALFFKVFGVRKWRSDASDLAEREGFEPPIGLHLCRISSAVHSTTLPPLLKGADEGQEPLWSGRVLGEDGGGDKARGAKIRHLLTIWEPPESYPCNI